MPARKPRHLKVVTGTLEASRDNPGEPRVSGRCPAPPAHLEGYALERYEALREFFDRHPGWVGQGDAEALTRYCTMLAEERELLAVIADEGRVARWTNQGGGETVQRHPATTMLRETRMELRQLEKGLGLMPADRSRVAAEEARELDPLEELIEEGKR